MSPLVNRLVHGDTVDISYNGVVWYSGVYQSVNPDGSYSVMVVRNGTTESFPYDMVKPTQATIDKHTEIKSDVPAIEESEDDHNLVYDNEDPATSGLEPD